MTDWQLWREDFAQGYVDAVHGRGTIHGSDAYNAGHDCGVKVLEAEIFDLPFMPY